MRMATCHPDRKYHALGLCVLCYKASWARDHPDREKARHASYHAAHRAERQAYREAHREKANAYASEWHARTHGAEPGAACSQCGWDKANCDIHRIVPGGPYIKENVRVLCPNCHRLAHGRHLTKPR